MAQNFAEMLKAKRKEQEEKEYADVNQPRWNYILNCNHDLHEYQQCPMCLLVAASTKKFLLEEAKENAIARRVGTYHRAQIRYAMLDVWSRNQPSLAAERHIGLNIDIHLNGPVLDALLYFATSTEGVLPTNASVVSGIQRRKRIVKVGQYAATFLQCRMRKVTTRQRLRKYFLRRFDFFPQDKYIKYDHYIDKKTTKRWKQKPRILRNERPGSPRTIARRINMEEKKSLDRKRQFEKLMGTKFRLDRGDAWTLESETLLNMQRIILLKDVLSLAGALLHNRRFDFDEESADHVMPRKERSTAASRRKATPLPSAVWVSLSAPAPPARALGLSIVLNTLPAINDMSTDKEEIDLEERDLEREAEEDEVRRLESEAQDEPVVATQRSNGGFGTPPASPSRQASSGFRGGFRAESPSRQSSSMSRGFRTDPPAPAPAPASARQASSATGSLRPDSSSRSISTADSTLPVEATLGAGENESRAGTAASGAAAEEPVDAGELSVMQRLVMMEQFAWEALRCGSVDDILRVLMCEELQAPFNSVMNIAEDDLGMWDYNMISKRSADVLTQLEAERVAKEKADAEKEALRRIEQKKLDEERRMEEKRKARRKRGAYDDGESSGTDSEDEREKAAQAAFEEKKRAEAARAAGLKPVVAPVVEVVVPEVLPSKVLIAQRLAKSVKHAEDYKAQVKMNITEGAAAAKKAKLFAAKKRAEILELRRQREESAGDQFAVAMHVPTEAELAEEERWLAASEEEPQGEEASAPVTDTQGHCRHDKLDIVPMTIHLRPCNVKKQSHECFRLFFLDFELVAITPWSPWAFHGEIIRSKDLVMNTLVSYAQRNLDLKKLMRQIVKKANEDDFHRLSRNPTASGVRPGPGTVGGAGAVAPTGPPRGSAMPGRPGGGQSMDDVGFCVDLYVPSERHMFPSPLCDVTIPTRKQAEAAAAAKEAAKLAFDAAAAQKAKASHTRVRTKKKTSEDNVRMVALSPMTQQAPLSPTDTVALNDKFLFLQHLWEWRRALKYARSKLPKVEPVGGVASVKKQLADKKAAIAAAAEKKKAAEKAAADKKAGVKPMEELVADVVEVLKPVVVAKPLNEDELDEIAPDHETAKAFSMVARTLKNDQDLVSLLGGQEIFNAACLDLPGWISEPEEKDKKKAPSAAASDSSHAEEKPAVTADSMKAEDYLRGLKNYTTLADTSMAMRLSFNEDCGALPDRPVYDLVCVEVTLDLAPLYAVPYTDPAIIKNQPVPRTEREKKKLLAMKAAAKEQLGRLPKTLAAPHFHQLVGVFPSRAERAPSSVDTGLFEWEYFRDYKGPQSADDDDDKTAASGSVASGGAASLASPTKKGVLPPIGSPSPGGSQQQIPGSPGAVSAAPAGSSLFPEAPVKNGWDQPNQMTGVQTYYGTPTGTFTKTYQVKLLGKEPAPEYFAQNMPRKIRLWLGI